MQVTTTLGFTFFHLSLPILGGNANEDAGIVGKEEKESDDNVLRAVSSLLLSSFEKCQENTCLLLKSQAIQFTQA